MLFFLLQESVQVEFACRTCAVLGEGVEGRREMKGRNREKEREGHWGDIHDAIHHIMNNFLYMDMPCTHAAIKKFP